MPDRYPSLAAWQQAFVDDYLRQPRTRSLLFAAPQTGLAVTSLWTAREMVRQGRADGTLVLTDLSLLRDQWAHVAQRLDLRFRENIHDAGERGGGLSLTMQSLRSKDRLYRLHELARQRRWFIIADNVRFGDAYRDSVVDSLLSLNGESKALFVARGLPSSGSFGSEFRYDAQHILDRSIIEHPHTEIQLAQFSPSFTLLRQLQREAIRIDDLSWRSFEKLIAELLERDGYEVELMKGSKDGGVDVVAVKNLGAAGYFKALWQAKKQSLKNKVGISVIRELADTRQEFGASKGIIVTSSYLTRGALERVERDNYLLGKVDRDDLDQWIRRTLMGFDA
jgi:HJR/Mrr/RecB family endonuclease